MSQHLLRVAVAMVALASGASTFNVAAAPYPTIKVKIVDGQSAPSAPQSDAPKAQSNSGRQATVIPTEYVRVEPVQTATAPTPTDNQPETSEVVATAPAQPAEQATEDVKTVEVAPVISAPPAIVWQVDVRDGTIRQALSRWALDAGWVDHWELDFDIPITASATLATTNDFTEAVQSLAEAVALSEMPFRPCFYSNQVVRVIPYNAMCNRMMARPSRD